ncbi:MAG TPA: hypothetical protein PL120_01460 [Bacilli bacterium]|nr:hypothetical protein [Bacilli bacterium]HPK86182.1 hypothetical protein [Bacilli bacterium]
MVNFLKRIGVGMITLLLTPFALAGFVLFAVGTIFVFLFYSILAVIKYFQGDRLKEPSELDRRAARILKDRLDSEQVKDEPKTAEQGQFAGATINIFHSSNPFESNLNPLPVQKKEDIGFIDVEDATPKENIEAIEQIDSIEMEGDDE